MDTIQDGKRWSIISFYQYHLFTRGEKEDDNEEKGKRTIDVTEGRMSILFERESKIVSFFQNLQESCTDGTDGYYRVKEVFR